MHIIHVVLTVVDSVYVICYIHVCGHKKGRGEKIGELNDNREC